MLDPRVTFLNHGSFGALPREVMAAQDTIRAEIELDPVEFLVRGLPPRLEEARAEVAAFLGAEVSGLVFVRNATEAVSATLGSVPLAPGDEILTTNHRYGAVGMAMARRAALSGAVVVEAEVPYPIERPAQAVDAVAARITDRTRLLVIDRITSPTALILPVTEIAAIAHAAGVPVLVDGAHVPGQLPDDISRSGADFWTGNLHKWAFAPRGTAVLWVSPAWLDRCHAAVVSHGYNQGLHKEFDWPGTYDPSGWLTAPVGLRFHARLGGRALMAANHALVRDGRQVIANALRMPLPHPDDAGLYGSMASVQLPVKYDGRGVAQADALHDALIDRERVQVPVFAWGDRLWVRVSGQVYNEPSDYVRAADALRAVLGI